MADLKVFAKRIRALAVDVDERIDSAVVQTAIVANQTVVAATPVDTGRARANWVVGLDKPIRDTHEEVDQSGQETNAINKTQIKKRKSGQTIYISNNLDYIGDLNDGSSSQAPANFVGIAVRAAEVFLRRKKIIK